MERSGSQGSLSISNITHSKTVTNVSAEVLFKTEIDILMGVIQAKEMDPAVVKQEATSEETNTLSPTSSAQGSQQASNTGEAKTLNGTRPKNKERKHKCDMPGCRMAFVSKPYLNTHRRAHTGEKPYVRVSELARRVLN